MNKDVLHMDCAPLKGRASCNRARIYRRLD